MTQDVTVPRSTLLRASALLFAMLMVGAVANYLFQFYASRRLTPAEFAELNSLLAVFLIAGVGASVLLQTMASYTARFAARGEAGQLAMLLQRALIGLTMRALPALVVFVLVAPALQRFLHLPSLMPLLATALAVLAALYVNVAMGVLQGLQRFFALGICNTQGVVRLLLGVLLIGGGAGATGGLLATAGASLAALAFALFTLRARFRPGAAEPLAENLSIGAYGRHVLVGMLCFNVIGTCDLLAARHYFDAADSGQYAAAVVLGRVVLYAPAAIVLAIFPMVAQASALGAATAHLLKKAIVMTAGTACGIAVGYAVAPALGVTLLLGQQYLDAAPLLRWYGLAVVPQAILSLLMNFNLAHHNTRFVFGLLPVCVMQIVALALFHASPYQLILTMALASTAGVAVALSACRASLATSAAVAGVPVNTEVSLL